MYTHDAAFVQYGNVQFTYVNRNTANTHDAKFVQQYILTMLIVILWDMYSHDAEFVHSGGVYFSDINSNTVWYVQLWYWTGPIWKIIFQGEQIHLLDYPRCIERETPLVISGLFSFILFLI